MHMPFCTVADKCSQCDNVRANREIRRLREVLRVTLDELIAEREEAKDLNAKAARLYAENAKWKSTIVELGTKFRELELSVSLVQQGKLSASDVFPPSYKLLGAEIRRLELTGEGEGNY